MKMKKLIIYSIGLAVLVTSVSCEKRFDELNVNPSNPENAPSQMLLANAIINTAYRIQLTAGLNLADQWMQQTRATTYMEEDRYSPRAGNVTNLVWSSLYSVSFADCVLASNLAKTNNQPDNEAIGYILKAYIGYNLTMLYGDVPYTQAAQGKEYVKPVYDGQKVVLEAVIADLDKAIAIIGGTTDATVAEELTRYDYIYGGKMQKWKKLANGLKLRAYLALTTGGTDKKAEINALLASPDIFQSTADDAKLTYVAATGASNPVFQWITSARKDDFRMSSSLVDYMMGSSVDSTNPADPRLKIYADPVAKGANAGKYVGGKNGSKGAIGDNSTLGSKFYNATSPFVFMSYAEVLFIKAEMDPTNAANYTAAVTASFVQNGLTATDATTALLDPKFAFNPAKGEQLIAEQKWIALYGQGVEAFNNWRRTGFPLLAPATLAATNGGTIPRRVCYNTDELILNTSNATAASGTLTPAVDVVSSKTWFDRNHPLNFGNK
jgi:putative sterol carrier protein